MTDEPTGQAREWGVDAPRLRARNAELRTRAEKAEAALARSEAEVERLREDNALLAELKANTVRANTEAWRQVAVLREALFDHFPMLECDHEAKRDRVICGCSLVDLGWHPNIGEARRSWIAHIAALDSTDESAEAIMAALRAADAYKQADAEWFPTVNARPFDAQASAQAAYKRTKAFGVLRDALDALRELGILPKGES